MIFPSKKDLIQMKTNRMNSVNQEDVGTMGEQFSSAQSGKIQCQIFRGFPVWLSHGLCPQGV